MLSFRVKARLNPSSFSFATIIKQSIKQLSRSEKGKKSLLLLFLSPGPYGLIKKNVVCVNGRYSINTLSGAYSIPKELFINSNRNMHWEAFTELKTTTKKKSYPLISSFGYL